MPSFLALETLLRACPTRCPEAPVPDASVYINVLTAFQEIKAHSAVLVLLMEQAVAWHKRGADLTVGESLDAAMADVNALVRAMEGAGESGGRAAARRELGGLRQLLERLDHPPLTAALYLHAAGSKPAAAGAHEAWWINGLLNRDRPRTARWLATAAPSDWRWAAAWAWTGAHSMMGRMQLDPAGDVHPAAVAAARGLWDVAAALRARQPFSSQADRDLALNAGCAALGRIAPPESQRLTELARARSWIADCLTEGANPNAPVRYVPENGAVCAPFPTLTSEPGLGETMTANGWSGKPGPGGMVEWTRDNARTVYGAQPITASEWVLQSAHRWLGWLRSSRHDAERRTHLDFFADMWRACGGPQVGSAWFPNSVTALVHGVVPAHEVGLQGYRDLMETWLPVCQEADTRWGRTPWWTQGPSAAQPWDAWGLLANLATHPRLFREGGTLLQLLLQHLPEGTALPVEAVRRMGALLVASTSWAPTRDNISGSEVLQSKSLGRERFVVVLWNAHAEMALGMVAGRLGADQAAAVERWLQQVRTDGLAEAATMLDVACDVVQHKSDPNAVKAEAAATARRVTDRAALTWTAVVDGAGQAPAHESRVGRKM